VPCGGGKDEADGYLLTYVFDESELDEHRNASEDVKSELLDSMPRDEKRHEERSCEVEVAATSTIRIECCVVRKGESREPEGYN
jgi:hypothetical protein